MCAASVRGRNPGAARPTGRRYGGGALVGPSPVDFPTLIAPETQFAAFAKHVPCVVFRGYQPKDGPRKIGYCSPKLQEIFGIADIQQLGSFIHPDDLAASEATVATAVAAGAPVNVEFRLVVPGQPLRWCRSMSVASGQDAHGCQCTHNSGGYWG